MLFDLDDTLLDRDKAVDNMFFIIFEKCYEDVKHTTKKEMLQRFKDYDKRSYGNSNKTSYGNSNKTKVLEGLFNEFPPKYRLPSQDLQDFWNNHFPQCFSVNQSTINILNSIKEQVKVAIITNGSTQRQKAKIINTNLNSYFDTIIISEEVGLSKPDKRIFELALNRLNVRPESALFVGDNLELDIGGSQNANIKGIWFNPHSIKNDTEITPFAEINSFEKLLSYLP
ncbi:HAD-IA family hydrolase [Ornithinibacillus sp. FSL M8-0202]|uniref:HAD family hydrolase n=1 Tax=Ornithinibacillus sp. FSL M8-0202 TaxID=2921616 RepID=UPI0030CF8740